MNDSGFNFGGPAKREPNADIRNLAVGLHEFYTAQKDAGFDKAQAFQLTMKFLESVMKNGQEGGNG